jgi:RND family efflux transporter MFP subunit
MKRMMWLPLLLALASGCAKVSSAPPSVPPESAGPPPVETVRPERTTLPLSVALPGQIEGVEQTALYAKIPGYVEALHVDIGDHVKAGQVLAELSIPETREELKQKEAIVAQSRAEIVQAQRTLKAANANVKKAEALLAQAKTVRTRAEASVIRYRSEEERVRRLVRSRAAAPEELEKSVDQARSSASVLDETVAAITTAEAALAESEAMRDKAASDVKVAEARLGVAEAEMRRMAEIVKYAKITSPFDGVVTRRDIDTGALMQPSGGGPGTAMPLFKVVRSATVRIFVDVPEGEAVSVRVGMPVRVRVQALGEQEFEGKVTRFSWALDTTSRTLRTRIDLPNPDGRLRPGMYAHARLRTERSGTLTVPASSLVMRDDRPHLMLVEGDRVVRTGVKIGARHGERVEVLRKQTGPERWEALSGTEEVVRAPVGLVDGQPVQRVGGTRMRARR